jgi:hypothetical protein
VLDGRHLFATRDMLVRFRRAALTFEDRCGQATRFEAYSLRIYLIATPLYRDY